MQAVHNEIDLKQISYGLHPSGMFTAELKSQGKNMKELCESVDLQMAAASFCDGHGVSASEIYVECRFQCVKRSAAGHPAVKQSARRAFDRGPGECFAPSSTGPGSNTCMS